MSTLVCFTGKADILGNKIDRHHLEAACQRLGWRVTEKPEQHMNGILVASRTGTKKDQMARSMGWTIMTYDEFAGHLHMNGVHEVGGVVLSGGGAVYTASDQRREQQEAKARVAAKRAARRAEAEELQANPMWGAWG